MWQTYYTYLVGWALPGRTNEIQVFKADSDFGMPMSGSTEIWLMEGWSPQQESEDTNLDRSDQI